MENPFSLYGPRISPTIEKIDRTNKKELCTERSTGGNICYRRETVLLYGPLPPTRHTGSRVIQVRMRFVQKKIQGHLKWKKSRNIGVELLSVWRAFCVLLFDRVVFYEKFMFFFFYFYKRGTYEYLLQFHTCLLQ